MFLSVLVLPDTVIPVAVRGNVEKVDFSSADVGHAPKFHDRRLEHQVLAGCEFVQVRDNINGC